MPEIESCRKCAECCNSCIFLEYNKKTDLFGCLIYQNKQREPVHHGDSINDIMSEIQLISGFQNKWYRDDNCEVVRHSEVTICHEFKCFTIYDEERGKISKEEAVNITKNKIIGTRENWTTWIEKGIKKTRKKIPNFNVLVEILNSTQPYVKGIDEE